jgi:hypothetical protein
MPRREIHVPPDVFILIPLAGMATGALFMFGIYKIVTRWMDLRHHREPGALPPDELRELQLEVAELRALPDRVAELEERLDFAERLLAQHRTDVLPGER